MEKRWILKFNSLHNCLKVTVPLFLTAFFFPKGKGVLNYEFCWFSSSAWFFPCSSPTKIFVALSNPSSSGEIMIDPHNPRCQGEDSDPDFCHWMSGAPKQLLSKIPDELSWRFSQSELSVIYCNIQVSFLGDLSGVLTWCQSVCVFFFHILWGVFCAGVVSGRLAVGSEISSCCSATFCLSAGAGWVIKWLQGLSKIIFVM